MMLTRPISKEAAEGLFQKECFLIGRSNGVDQERAEKLLGKAAVRYGIGKLGEDSNVYGILLDGDEEPIQVHYLYKSGFMRACSYRNVELLLEGEQNV